MLEEIFHISSAETVVRRYFDGEDLNKDGVVIDENVAWQLFGSNNVAGMYVEINGVQYPVRGVVKSDKGYFSDAADEEAATVYVSYEILEGRSGSSTGGMDSAAARLAPGGGHNGFKGWKLRTVSRNEA